jgi:hypothetical protein
MSAMLIISWFVALLVSMALVHIAIGNHGLVTMFPEGHRWWMPWTRHASLVVFAAVVLANPFNGWLA